MNAGGTRGASRSGSASVPTIHALFTTEAECAKWRLSERIYFFTHLRIP
jgi:hypothetical protein